MRKALRRLGEWYRLLRVLGYIDERRFLPTKLREWYERQMRQARAYIGKVRCHCPDCGTEFQREVGIRLIGRVLVGVYKALVHGAANPAGRSAKAQ